MYFIHRSLWSQLLSQRDGYSSETGDLRTGEYTTTGSYLTPTFLVFSPLSGIGEGKECSKIHRTRALTLEFL